MAIESPFREGEDIDKFLRGGFRAQDDGGRLYNRRQRVTSGSIIGKDGSKIRGWIRITDQIGPDGKSREVRTEFKPFNVRRDERGNRIESMIESDTVIPASEARTWFGLSNPDNLGLSTFSKRNTYDEQRNDDVARRFAERVGGRVPENAMDNGQHDAGHFSGTPEIAKDTRSNRAIPEATDGAATVAFSGYVIQNGIPKTPTGTPNLFVKVPADGSAPSYVAARVIGDPDAEYYEVAQTFGNIHLDRF